MNQNVNKYVKKPIEIEAIQYKGIENVNECLAFATSIQQINLDDGRLYINTLEGKLEVSVNDYIIKGIKGEFYPCKPDIFEMTYDLIK